MHRGEHVAEDGSRRRRLGRVRVARRGDRGRSLSVLAALATASALVLTACSGGGGGGGSSDSPGTSPEASGTPKAGGTLTFGVFQQTVGLDPAVSTGDATTGGTELEALYDSMLRYDPKTGAYSPGTALSVTPDPTSTVWTLKLRPGIRFTDGTPYNVQAVKYNFDRYVAKKSTAAAYVSHIVTYDIVDDLTMVMTLDAPWSSFPFVFAYNSGCIVSPTAIEKLGDQLNTNPVGAGAGPFEFESYKAGESVVLRRNPDYWDTAPYLDQVRFVRLGGAQATYDGLKAGAIQAGLLREPPVVKQAQDDGTPGYVNLRWGGTTLFMNNGLPVTCSGGKPVNVCAGAPDGKVVAGRPPTADLRVRQAVAAAIDPKVMNDRADDGAGFTSSDLFGTRSRWYVGTAGPAYDPARARSLVADLKAQGVWDGSLTITADNSTISQARGLALQAMLNAVGMNVSVRGDLDSAGAVSQIIVKKDYELGISSLGMDDNDPTIVLAQRLRSGSTSNWLGYSSKDMDAALADALAAGTPEAKKQALDRANKVYLRDVPAVVLEASVEYTAWAKNVHGIEPTVNSIVHLDRAWIG